MNSVKIANVRRNQHASMVGSTSEDRLIIIAKSSHIRDRQNIDPVNFECNQ